MPALFSGFPWFSGETASAGFSVLLILAKATIVLLAALGVTRAMERGSAVSRHLVWFVALGAVLLIPALASWSPLRLAILPPVDSPSEMLVPSTSGPVRGIEPAPSIAPSVSVPLTERTSSNVSATVNTVRDIVSPKTPWFGILSDPKLLFAIWASVALLFAGWLGYGAMSVHRIIRRSRP